MAKTEEKLTKDLRVRLVRGKAGSTQRQRRTLESLGLGRTGSYRDHDASPQVLGMINKVQHLVEVTKK